MNENVESSTFLSVALVFIQPNLFFRLFNTVINLCMSLCMSMILTNISINTHTTLRHIKTQNHSMSFGAMFKKSGCFGWYVLQSRSPLPPQSVVIQLPLFFGGEINLLRIPCYQKLIDQFENLTFSVTPAKIFKSVWKSIF